MKVEIQKDQLAKSISFAEHFPVDDLENFMAENLASLEKTYRKKSPYPKHLFMGCLPLTTDEHAAVAKIFISAWKRIAKTPRTEKDKRVLHKVIMYACPVKKV